MLLNKELKSVLSVSSITIFSRITGLIRDVLVFSFLGASLWSSAFILAFTIPNLFRRLFGEGALTSAFIPLLANVRKKEGDDYAFRFFNMFCTNWFFYLLLLCLLSIFNAS